MRKKDALTAIRRPSRKGARPHKMDSDLKYVKKIDSVVPQEAHML